MSPDAKARRRANKKLGMVQLERKNDYGFTDLTPYNASRKMNGKNIVTR